MANNAPNRKHYCDEHIFDVIDTPAKAYWLGVLYADGHITTPPKGYTKLEVKDLDWLQQFKTFMKSEHNIIPGRGTHIFSIGSQYLNKSLQQYGIVPNKTYNHDVEVYTPNGELENHFWRGAWDGDGCIGYYPLVKSIHQRCRLVLAGKNKFFMNKCQNFFLKYNIKGYIASKHSKNSNYYHWCYGPRPAYKARHFLDILYLNSTPEIRLERKYNKAQEIYTAAKEPIITHKRGRPRIVHNSVIQLP